MEWIDIGFKYEFQDKPERVGEEGPWKDKLDYVPGKKHQKGSQTNN